MTKYFIAVVLVLQASMLFFNQPVPASAAEFPVTLTPYGEINEDQAEELEAIGATRKYTLDDPQLSDIPLLVGHAIKFLLGCAGAMALFFFSTGAFDMLFMIPIEKKQEGKKKMIDAIFGLSIILLAYIIVDTLLQVLF